MAYREVGMWEILDVLRRVGRGESKSAVKRATGHGRATIRRYVETATELGWVAGHHEPDEKLAADVFARLRPGQTAKPGEVEQRLLEHKQQISDWLKPDEGQRRGLRLTKVHELLGRQGVRVPYSSLHRFAVKHCDFADRRRLTVRVADCEPGELAEVDFGRLGLVPDPERGGRRVAWALCVTLVHSRHQYVHVTFSQKLPDLIDGLEDAWEFFGGVTARVVLDNLKAAITKADRYDPTVQRVFDEYAGYRGFVVDPAVPRHAKGKPHVERNVQYVRDSFFAGETWQDLAQVQREARRWCLRVAGSRVHGTTRQVPLGVFDNVERPELRPLTRPRFDTPHWGKCKVHGDHHISFLKALYSVPTRHVGKRLWVRGDSKLVRIYADGQQVKVHERQPPGGRSTDYNDYPPERAAYAMRDPDRIVAEAQRRGEHIARLMQALLAPPFPWKNLRQGQKLLRLGNKYGFDRVDSACQRALAFDLINVKRVERIIELGLDRAESRPHPDAPATVVQLPLRFARPAQSFVHKQTEGDDHE
jgi:transposase